MKPLFYLLLVTMPFAGFSYEYEQIDRGIIALAVSEKEVFVSWRLLTDDPENVAFNVYRKDIGLGDFEKVNEQPVTASTNFMDDNSPQVGFK